MIPLVCASHLYHTGQKTSVCDHLALGYRNVVLCPRTVNRRSRLQLFDICNCIKHQKFSFHNLPDGVY
jgi:hypothetical protein